MKKQYKLMYNYKEIIIELDMERFDAEAALRELSTFCDIEEYEGKTDTVLRWVAHQALLYKPNCSLEFINESVNMALGYIVAPAVRVVSIPDHAPVDMLEFSVYEVEPEHDQIGQEEALQAYRIADKIVKEVVRDNKNKRLSTVIDLLAENNPFPATEKQKRQIYQGVVNRRLHTRLIAEPRMMELF